MAPHRFRALAKDRPQAIRDGDQGLQGRIVSDRSVRIGPVPE